MSRWLRCPLVVGGSGLRFWLTDGGPPLELASPPLELVPPVKERQVAPAKRGRCKAGKVCRWGCGDSVIAGDSGGQTGFAEETLRGGVAEG